VLLGVGVVETDTLEVSAATCTCVKTGSLKMPYSLLGILRSILTFVCIFFVLHAIVMGWDSQDSVILYGICLDNLTRVAASLGSTTHQGSAG
jgi:hypothetical protein